MIRWWSACFACLSRTSSNPIIHYSLFCSLLLLLLLIERASDCSLQLQALLFALLPSSWLASCSQIDSVVDEASRQLGRCLPIQHSLGTVAALPCHRLRPPPTRQQAHTAAVSTATCCCMQHAFTCSAAPWNIMENIYGDGSYHRRPPRPGPKFLTYFFFPPCSSCRNNPHIYIIRPRQLLRSVVWVVCFIYLLLPKQKP